MPNRMLFYPNKSPRLLEGRKSCNLTDYKQNGGNTAKRHCFDVRVL